MFQCELYISFISS